MEEDNKYDVFVSKMSNFSLLCEIAIVNEELKVSEYKDKVLKEECKRRMRNDNTKI